MALRNVSFITSSPDQSNWIEDDIPEILLLGRSNVGKSTFINRMCNQRQLARVSSEPGRTRLLNFFLVDERYRLVDAPGYGFSKVKVHEDAHFEKMMMEYLTERKNLVAAVLLLDSRRIPNREDILMVKWMSDHHLTFLIVATKTDKLSQKEKAQFEISLTEVLQPPSYVKVYKSSLKSNDWIEEVTLKLEDILSKKALAKKRT